MAEPPLSGEQFEKNKDACLNSDKKCDVLSPARLVRRYQPLPTGNTEPFEGADVYSVELEQGAVGENILEGLILGHQFGTTAQIAILANVFEFASNEADAGSRGFINTPDLQRLTEKEKSRAKLIYFGDDIKKGQAFNFSTITLMPKTEYHGGTIGIQIFVMEIDAKPGPVFSLLKTLAELGKSAIPTPPGIGSALLDLGTSLANSSSNDDKLFEYRFELTAPSGQPDTVKATFAPGRYVLRRMQRRLESADWSKFEIDHNTGRLYETDTTGRHEVHDDLYLVLNVMKYPKGTRPDYYDFEQWGAFREYLQKAADEKAVPINSVTNNLTAVLLDKRSGEWKSDETLRWSKIQNLLVDYSSKELGDLSALDLSKCSVDIPGLRRRADAASRAVKDELRDFLSQYQLGLGANYKDIVDGTMKSEFSEADRNKLVSYVARYFMPWTSTGPNEALFKDAAAFEKAFVHAGATNDLAKVSIDLAISRAEIPSSCDMLISRGLAKPVT